MISIVIPVHKEEPDLLALYDRLTRVLERLEREYEVIFVDDTPGDRSFDLLANLAETDGRLKILRLRRNSGQSAALAAGFDEARGEIVISLDANLRHSPEDVPLLLEKIDQGYDIASGWRKNAPTTGLGRFERWIMKRASGVDLHDIDTPFKAYRSDVLKNVNLYGELHRFIPALASFYGARIAEVPIRNNMGRGTADRRRFSLRRMLRAFVDAVTIKFLLHYLTRPMHFFGKWGLLGVVVGTVILVWMAVSKLLGNDIITEHGPLLVAGALVWFAGLMLFSAGLIGEVLMRTYFESQGRRIYAVREVRCRRQTVADGA